MKKTICDCSTGETHTFEMSDEEVAVVHKDWAESAARPNVKTELEVLKEKVAALEAAANANLE